MKSERSLCTGLFSVLAIMGGLCLGRVEAAPPNVLLISIDDLNDWVGFLKGHPQAKTPNMDRLAGQGMVFSNAHCVSPLCCPSRAAVFSGCDPASTGVYTNADRIRELRADLVLLPQYFSSQGYDTYGTGKLLHREAPDLFDESFFCQQEQRWSPLPGRPNEAREQAIQSLPLNDMPSDRHPSGTRRESFDWGPFDVSDEEMGDGKVASWAIDKIDTHSGKPFLLCVGFYRPHIPLWAPRQYFQDFPSDSIVLPPVAESDLDDVSKTARRWALEPITAGAHRTVVEHQQWKPAVAAYLACVSFVDAQIGRLVRALEASPHADNTIIVLWSDHGWHLGEKQHWGKWTGWERSTRVPLAIAPTTRSSEKYQTGQVCGQPVSLLDLYPTLIELCGLPKVSHLEGDSLVPQLVNSDEPTEPVLTTFNRGNFAVRSRRYRLIHYAEGSEELYDHKSDPNEWHNLIAEPDADEIVMRLRKRLPRPRPADATDQ